MNLLEFLPNYPPIFWGIAIFTILLVGIAKAGFGTVAGLSTSLLALVLPVPEAAALLLPLLLIADSFSVYHYANLKEKQAFDWQSLMVLLPGAIVGIFIGALFFDYFSDNERLLRIFVGALALLFLAYQLLRTLILGTLEKSQLPKSVGVLLGTVAGFTSTLVHAGAPPMAIYLLPQRLPRHLYVGTLLILFFIVNLVKLIPYTYLGLLQFGDLSTILLLSPLCYIGVRLGVYLNRKFSEQWFNRIVYSLLFLTGVQLISGRNLIELFQ